MADEKSPIEQALDLFVFAPLGLAVTAQENLPELIEKGRQRVQGQVAMARMVGEFATKEAQRQAEKQVRKVTESLAGSRRAAQNPGPSAAAASAPVPAPSPGSTPNPAPAAPTANGSSNGRSTVRDAKPAASAASLAIPNYDALSASQVVQRLAGLSAEELEAVRAYEEATRGRRTILAKAAQLQSESTS